MQPLLWDSWDAVRLLRQSLCGLGESGLIQRAGRRRRRRREKGGGEAGSLEDVGKETSGRGSFGKKVIDASCPHRTRILSLMLLLLYN